MTHGICLLAMAAMRADASHKSELVNQLIFGDLFEVLYTKEEWLFVRLEHDQYQGWVNENQICFLTQDEYNTLVEAPALLSADHVQLLENLSTGAMLLIGAGCNLYFPDNDTYAIAGKVFRTTGKTQSPRFDALELVENALQFLDAPYLWGGRTPFGLDCSGFMQLVFKLSGIRLPRDASQQAKVGTDIHLISDAKTGDLVFFGHQEKPITHVGMLLSEGKIIHAFGKVRIDHVDHLGIFNKEKNAYTHFTRLIKRVAE